MWWGTVCAELFRAPPARARSSGWHGKGRLKNAQMAGFLLPAESFALTLCQRVILCRLPTRKKVNCLGSEWLLWMKSFSIDFSRVGSGASSCKREEVQTADEAGQPSLRKLNTTVNTMLTKVYMHMTHRESASDTRSMQSLATKRLWEIRIFNQYFTSLGTPFALVKVRLCSHIRPIAFAFAFCG
jgi:hypothetical protein